ncbi:hypothetical protein EFP00_02575 [Lactiplantibacillus paraplantarum]|nr:hypothetical protein [Lactiplantibacillus paraplantarum]
MVASTYNFLSELVTAAKLKKSFEINWLARSSLVQNRLYFCHQTVISQAYLLIAFLNKLP